MHQHHSAGKLQLQVPQSRAPTRSRCNLLNWLSAISNLKKCTGSGAASTFSTLSFQELLRPILSNPDVRQTAGGFFRKSKFHRASVALGSVLSGGIVHFTHPFSVIINLRQSISSRARLHFSTCSGAKRA